MTWIISIGHLLFQQSWCQLPICVCVMLMWLSHFPISIPSSIWYVSSPFCKTCSRFKTKSLWADTMTGIELQNKETNWTKMKREQCMYIINFRNILLSELSIIKDSNLSRVSKHRECYTITFEQKAFVKDDRPHFCTC